MNAAGPNGELIYNERVASIKTEALFLALAGLSLMLARRARFLAPVFSFFFFLFLFYSLNYRTLITQITPRALRLKFGLFTWSVPLENIAECRPDEVPLLLRMGGAGIHFMTVRNRYRASFNFLEYPRVVIELKRKAGPVRDISFSTRRPEEVIRLIQAAVTARG